MKDQLTADRIGAETMRGDKPIGTANPALDGFDRKSVIRFGRFCVLPHARRILADGEPIELGGRAFDLLILLIAAGGRLMTKHEIMDRLWPAMIVEESNLHVQVSTLRRALGEDRDVIKTVARRGYLFAAEVSLEPAMAGNSPVISLVTAATPNAQAPPFGSLCVGLPGRQPFALAHSSASARDQIPAVAVIDDDSDVREALRGLLRSVGLRVELFASVQEFLDASHAFVPSCLVLDVRLPGRSGLDFLDEIAKERVPLPVIFISGHADVPMSVRAMKAGAFEFLTKPVRHQELLDAIHRATGTVLLNVADASA